MPKPLTERGRLLEATSANATGGVRRQIQIITPGWGSSGYYSPAVLERASTNRVIPAGTLMFLDHSSVSEQTDRPERSVRDIAAVLTEDATWDGVRLAAEAHIFGTYADRIEELAPHIGVSISGSATDIAIGEAEGRTGPIVEDLAYVNSVDFVTNAGRGGKVLAVLESSRPVAEARNIGQWVESRIHRDFTVMADDMAGDGRLTREERIGLSSAIGDALAAFVSSLEANQPQLYTRDIWADPADTVATAIESHRAGIRRTTVESTSNDRREQLDTAVRNTYATSEDDWAWARDYEETDAGNTVWFERGGSTVGTWQQTYSVADDDSSVELTGDPVEVAVRTTYVPVDPAGRTTEESEEDTMPQIEEARLRELEEAAGRVTALEERATTAEARATTAEQTLAAERRRNRATDIVRDHRHAFTALEARGLVVDLPLTEAGELDEDAFRGQLDEHAATDEAARGAGTVSGFGATTEPTGGSQVTESKPTATPWGRPLTEKGA